MLLHLTGVDVTGSLLLSMAGGISQYFSYSAYGYAVGSDGLPGFNGERFDPLTGVSHLGNGYRAYSPALMRFTCPDSESPFGAGGINPYAYCEGDPINRGDPTGHIPGGRIVLGLVEGFEALAEKEAEKRAEKRAEEAVEKGAAKSVRKTSSAGVSGVSGASTASTSIAQDAAVTPQVGQELASVSAGSSAVGEVGGEAENIRMGYRADHRTPDEIKKAGGFHSRHPSMKREEFIKEFSEMGPFTYSQKAINFPDPKFVSVGFDTDAGGYAHNNRYLYEINMSNMREVTPTHENVGSKLRKEKWPIHLAMDGPTILDSSTIAMKSRTEYTFVTSIPEEWIKRVRLPYGGGWGPF